MARETLRFDISAVDKSAAAFGRVRTQLTGVQRDVNTISTATARFLGVFAVGFAARGLRGIASEMSNLADAASKVGLTTRQLQELRFAADQTGVSTQTLDMAMQRFSRRIGEAANGTGELFKTVQETGLELRNADGTMRSLHDIMRDYANIVARAGSDQEKLRLAFKAFDSEGAALVNTMADGAAGLDRMAQMANRLGIILDEDGIRKTKEFEEAWRRVSSVIETGVQSAFIDLVKEIDRTGEAIDRFMERPSVGGFFDAIGLGTTGGGLLGAMGVGESGPPPKFGQPPIPGIQPHRRRPITSIIPPTSNPGTSRARVGGPNDLTVDFMRQVRTETDQATEAANRFASIFGSGLSAVVTRGEKVSDVLSRITQQLAEQAIQALVGNLFSAGIGGSIGGGGPTNIKPPGFAGGFASGGSIPSGKFGLVGERGPELISGPARVTPMGQGGFTYAPTINAGMTATDRAWVRGQLERSQAEAVRMMQRQQSTRLRGRSDAAFA